ncbi:MAG: beta-propeller fold lactonase family protein [Terriglobales bacterium]
MKKTGLVVALVGIFALSALLMSCGSGDSRPSGLLYVVSQSLDNVSSFSVDLDSGELSLISDDLSPTCPTNSTCGLPTAISVDPTGATAFVMGQQAISSFTVNSNGTLSQPTVAATFPTGLSALAMSSTAAGDMLFVIASPASPSLTNEPQILAYSTKPGSTDVTLLTETPLSVVPTGVSVTAFAFPNQSAETLLFVTSNVDLNSPPNDSELSMFFVDSSGNLTEQSGSPYTAQAPNPISVLAVNTNPPQQNTGGVFVYVGNQAAVTGSVSAWEVCTQQDSACTAQDVQNQNLAVTGKLTTVGQNPFAMLVDPTNSFLYITCNVGNNVYGFKMTTNTGALTPLAPPLEPTGSSPVALAMHPSINNTNEFLYVANNANSTISGYTVDVTSGNLSNPMAPVIFTAGNPYGVAGR